MVSGETFTNYLCKPWIRSPGRPVLWILQLWNRTRVINSNTLLGINSSLYSGWEWFLSLFDDAFLDSLPSFWHQQASLSLSHCTQVRRKRVKQTTHLHELAAPSVAPVYLEHLLDSQNLRHCTFWKNGSDLYGSKPVALWHACAKIPPRFGNAQRTKCAPRSS